MGNTQARPGGGKLTNEEVQRLQRRFKRLAGPAPTLPISAFASMVELGANPFMPRMFQLFDADHDNRLSLDEFTKALEYFGSLEGEDAQYQFAFRIYDQDEDGLISGTELLRTLQSLVGSGYPEAQLEQVVLNTLQEFDRDGDGSLNFDEFRELLSAKDLQSKFALGM